VFFGFGEGGEGLLGGEGAGGFWVGGEGEGVLGVEGLGEAVLGVGVGVGFGEEGGDGAD